MTNWEFEGSVLGRMRSDSGEDRVICASASGSVRDDGTWLWRIDLGLANGPLIELEGDRASTIGTIIGTIHEVIAAAFQPQVISASGEEGDHERNTAA